MKENHADSDTIWVVTSEPIATRGSSKQSKTLKVEVLAENVNLFIGQMASVLEKTPDKLGKFHFEEFEVHAEVTGTGKLALFGTGAEVGGSGGLRFVFRRSSTIDTSQTQDPS